MAGKIQAPYYSPSTNNHLSPYSPPMTITDGGFCTMGSVSANSLALFSLGQTKTWGPSHVQPAPGTGNYGILGFRSAAA